MAWQRLRQPHILLSLIPPLPPLSPSGHGGLDSADLALDTLRLLMAL